MESSCTWYDISSNLSPPSIPPPTFRFNWLINVLSLSVRYSTEVRSRDECWFSLPKKLFILLLTIQFWLGVHRYITVEVKSWYIYNGRTDERLNSHIRATLARGRFLMIEKMLFKIDSKWWVDNKSSTRYWLWIINVSDQLMIKRAFVQLAFNFSFWAFNSWNGLLSV